jgi:ubiquinol-cytochrome c reductase cytochrome c subunit
MRPARLISFAAAAAFVFFVSWSVRAQRAGPFQRADAPSGNAQNGKKLYDSYGCYQCHGHHGEGTSAVGPRLAPPSKPLAALIKYVRQPTGQMPPYTSTVVSDADLADIYAYLISLPQPPKADTIPALK